MTIGDTINIHKMCQQKQQGRKTSTELTAIEMHCTISTDRRHKSQQYYFNRMTQLMLFKASRTVKLVHKNILAEMFNKIAYEYELTIGLNSIGYRVWYLSSS